MATMKIRIGPDFIESIAEIDGEAIRAHSAVIIVETNGYGVVEVERVVHGPEGKYNEVIRKRLEEPLEIEVEVPDSVKTRS